MRCRRVPALLPDCHVCVVRADRIDSSLPEALEKLDPRRPITWFSGPSATVDLETVREQGV
jgi:L-lactate dehydrogenase complex protein LldG